MNMIIKDIHMFAKKELRAFKRFQRKFIRDLIKDLMNGKSKYKRKPTGIINYFNKGFKMKYPKISQITIPKNYSLGRTGCTQTLARCFRECPRKFLLKVNRWQSKKNQEKFLIGSIVHDVLAYIYKNRTASNEKSVWLEICQYKMSQYISRDFIEYARTVSYCILINYVKYYSSDFRTAKFTNTEREFAVDINGIIWRGKIDGEHTIKKDKSLWVLETKNKSRINEETISKGLCFDFQGQIYCKAKEVETKKRVSGFIYNVIRIPQSKPKKNETLEQFSQRLQEDIASRPDYYFMRWEVPLADVEKKEFDTNLFILTSDLNRYFESNDKKDFYLINNTFSCTDGISPCEYLDACIQGNMSGYYQSEKIFEELECGI